MVLANAEFLFRTDHSVRLDTADAALTDLEATGEDRSRLGDGHVGPLVEVPCTTDDLLWSGTRINLTDPDPVGIRVRSDLQHLADVDVGPVGGVVLDPLDGEAQHVEGIADFLDIGRR